LKKILLILAGLWCAMAWGAEVIPPAPARYFNDYANVVPAATAAQLNQTLEDFERSSSDQILVAVFPKMQSDSSIEDYTVRVAQSWRVGQKAKDNGAVLFVFIADHKLYIQVGYGLEGALPDALCKRIIANEITPRFKAGDYNGGLSAGVAAILAAAKGEYKGTGRTVADSSFAAQGGIWGWLIMFFARHPFSQVLVCFGFLIVLSRLFRHIPGGGFLFTSGGSSGSGWSGGGFGGGGGGFSGGGGSFGGGGAGGSW
jgi:uncharacterized protein